MLLTVVFSKGEGLSGGLSMELFSNGSFDRLSDVRQKTRACKHFDLKLSVRHKHC